MNIRDGVSLVGRRNPPFSSCFNDMYYQPLGSFDSWTRDSIGNLLNPYTGSSSGRDDVWKALQDLDAGTEPDTVNLIYSEQDVKGSDHGTATTWNREHLWPKSHEVGQNGADFTDIHHLRPADWNVNSARSNLYFGACGLVQEISKCQIPAHSQAANDTSKDSSVFLPPINRRGDVARALFYMDLRYFGGAGDVDLELTDCPRPDNDNQMAYLSQLLEWHIADEVDDAERNRNDRACELWQGNRNIFVDHPELVAKIYGTPQTANHPHNKNGHSPCMYIVSLCSTDLSIRVDYLL
jgi:endonuclease I